MASNTNTDSLHALIMSLTKTEKAYFKKFASKHKSGSKNKYIMLFDAVAESNSDYNELKLRKKFSKEKFVKNLPVIKKYLYNMILKSLHSYYSNSDPENELKNEIRYIEILYKKSLFNNCIKIVNNSLKKAYMTDNFIAIAELLRWKKNLIYEGFYKGNEFINFEKANKEELENINRMLNLNRYRQLTYLARSFAKGTNPFHKNEEVQKELLNLLNDPLLQSEKQALSFSAEVAYYYVLALVYESLGKTRSTLDCRKKLIGLFEKHPEKLKKNIPNYITSIFNTLGTCFLLKEFELLNCYIEKLRAVGTTYSNEISANNMQLVLMGSSIFELAMHIKTGSFSNANRTIENIEKYFIEFKETILHEDLLQCYFLLAYAYFGSGDIIKSLEWLNKVLSDQGLNKESKLFVRSRILNLVIHYELGNIELLDYLIKSTYRYLKNSRFKGIEEQIIIDFLKKMPGITSQNQLLEQFTESLDKLKTSNRKFSMNNSGGKPLKKFEVKNSFIDIAEFDLESWLESKITGNAFGDVVKIKYHSEKINSDVSGQA